MGSIPMLTAKQVNKHFGSTHAVDDFRIEIKNGEIRGLIGENGSGKSTFASLLAGLYPKDSGEFQMNGEIYDPQSAVHAAQCGVSMVVQEIATIESLTVAANIYLNREQQFLRMGMLDFRSMNQAARKLMEEYGFTGIRADIPAGHLNLEQRKIVEIAKAMSTNPKLLIIDETSNALTKTGRDHLYRTIDRHKAEGGSVLFITHDMEELVQVCDSVTIMRDGRYVDTVVGDDMKPQKLKELMVGREISGSFYRNDFEASYEEEVVLRVTDLNGINALHISFELHKGEILGIGGLSDCGMHELGRTLFGLEKIDSGSVELPGKAVKITHPEYAIKNGMGYLSKNRDQEALIMNTSINDNISLPALEKLRKRHFLFRKYEKEHSEKWSDILNIKRNSVYQLCSALSGGNKQKVVIAKWLGNDTDILIMDCPTRGIDVGVKEVIYRLMEDLKRQGRSIIMISEELPELIGMSDRIIIMKDDHIVEVIERSKEVSEHQLINCMI